MPSLLLVMIGGAIGAGLRYEAGRLALRHFGPDFPWGTLLVNLAGGLLAGLLAGMLARHGAAGSQTARLLLGLGLLGGFTTFSAFSLETFNLLERGQYGLAGAYVGASVIGSVAALGAGLLLVRAASA
jgi:fluoride exporter